MDCPNFVNSNSLGTCWRVIPDMLHKIINVLLHCCIPPTNLASLTLYMTYHHSLLSEWHISPSLFSFSLSHPLASFTFCDTNNDVYTLKQTLKLDSHRQVYPFPGVSLLYTHTHTHHPYFGNWPLVITWTNNYSVISPTCLQSLNVNLVSISFINIINHEMVSTKVPA